jgi:hypothetical protein
MVKRYLSEQKIMKRIMIHTSGGKQTEEFVNNIKKVCNV